MKCQREDCGREATHAPRVCVPAAGHKAEYKTAMKMMAGIELCRDHARAFEVGQYLDEPNDDGVRLRDYIGNMLLGRGLCPPDWKRAWAVPVLLDDPDYLHFKRAQPGKLH